MQENNEDQEVDEETQPFNEVYVWGGNYTTTQS